MELYNLWLFSCAAFTVGSICVFLFQMAVSVAEAGLDRQAPPEFNSTHSSLSTTAALHRGFSGMTAGFDPTLRKAPLPRRDATSWPEKPRYRPLRHRASRGIA